MFNRVKFVVNKILFQTSKNKESFSRNKKIYNNKNNFNNNFNKVSVRKFTSSSKPPNEPNDLFLIATVVCGTLFTFKSTFYNEVKKD